ncbi:MAG: ABC transporter ATP-binding protein [Lachnospiraceae bacterium]|jgi:branched-chain amino acid transport system ATP-binding protein|nr:ABC transporter ATP-binding protein [Lachnospiraceae bacterium]
MSQNEAILKDGETLKIDHLSIHFGGLKAVDDLSFTVRDKEIFGLIGPNGAGKTTVFNCITQFYKPTAGAVYFRDNKNQVINLVGVPVHNVIRHGLVRTFQNVEVIKELSLLDNVLVGAHIDFKSSILSQALKLPGAVREEAAFKQKATDVLEFLEIADRKDEKAGGQPYGILKKVELARAIIGNSKLIILDEPAAGLNDTETMDLAAIIRKIRDAYNATILLVEHDMRLVMGICDRICAISFGKFLACDVPAEIQKNKLVQEAYLGEEE